MGVTLKLRYEGEEDLVPILNKLKTKNVDRIKFDSSDPENGPFQQDAANICDIIAKIFDKPNLNQISYLIDFDHDLDYNFLKNLEVKKLDLNACDFTMWIWKKIINATPNLEEISIHTEQDMTELPMIIKSLTGFSKLKSLVVQVDNYCEEEELRKLSMEDKRSLAHQAIKIMNECLPIEVKASVYEILDHDHLDDMVNGIDSPANKLILFEKEANEEPKLMMLQRSDWPPCFRMAGYRMVNGLRMASESESEESESEESEKSLNLNQKNQKNQKNNLL